MISRHFPALLVLVWASLTSFAYAQTMEQLQDSFRQLDEYLPTANIYRTASGAPGHAYWQQKVDYRIQVELDDKKQSLKGREKITYSNNSPDTLRYLWLQLDQNRFARGSMDQQTRTIEEQQKSDFKDFRKALHEKNFDGGHQLEFVRDASGSDLPFTIVETMMRVDLPTPLKPGQKFELDIAWSYKIVDGTIIKARGGYEYFKEDKNYIYEVAQWFPRLAAYSDYGGWHNKQFIGRGEFTLEFGNYDVSITVPADHIVTATGVLQNPQEVLSDAQRKRLEKAKKAKEPIHIVTPDEAMMNQAEATDDNKTWHFRADNVRDFAFASSRKFIWDAMGVYQKENKQTVLAMSFYPEEANPLWGLYSTQAVAHTLETYNKYALVYPYPVAISVHGAVTGGMEYPMISFNGYRPTKHEDGTRTYERRTKYGLISVVIHEVGHNYFPMIVNSDERQWTWMDEGINTFLQFLSEQEWEEDYPSRRGEPYKIVDYMKGDKQVPIMTNAESLLQIGNNAYAKPATALNILRESILGRDLFDFAFREYSRRWQFKRPTPADLFRTLEDASGVDLDWFWRGWFYTTGHVDISLDNVRHLHLDTKNPEVEQTWLKKKDEERPETLSEQRNKDLPKRIDRFKDLKDFYNENDEFTVTNAQRNAYQGLLKELEDHERELLEDKSHIYMLDLSNKGGLVMPVYVEVTYADGKKEEFRWAAEIWKKDSKHISKMLLSDKPIVAVQLDPHLETADVDTDNNHFPRKINEESRFDLFKTKKKRDMMKEMREPIDGAGKEKK
ncbi:M1 family metallopeptidase [Emcibacter sp.]|uniref:M1 family metallopeptidase n=1 Tax=Emcibacter sp. TaxID=1979954 RepID=UPI002AA7DCC4|nr:M1 family metallopeptidase [Emcibacter sp.]